jgi:hypothetical protein
MLILESGTIFILIGEVEMKTKFAATVLALFLLVGTLAGCSSNAAGTQSGGSSSSAAGAQASVSSNSATGKKQASQVNLKGMYTVKDPNGVDYDARYALYKPVIKSDDDYAKGIRYIFSVIYSKANKGQYLYSVDIFETEKQAKAYMSSDGKGKGKVDGKAYVTESAADFFAKMAAYMPTADDWVKNQKQSGMMDIEQ